MTGAKILVVEDDGIVGKHLSYSLKKLGFDVLDVVFSGEEALQVVEATPPDLILMDIGLRGELDGVETAEKIRAGLDIPIIYLTAYADRVTLERAKITDPFGYVLKPFDGRGLHTTIEMALHKHRLEKRLRESERRFRELAENVHEVFWMLDIRTNKILYISPAYERIWGKQCEGLYEEPDTFLDSVYPENREQWAETVHKGRAELLVNGNCLTDTEYQITRADGAVRWIWSRVFPVFDDNGALYRIAGVAEDVTERKQRERELEAIAVVSAALRSAAKRADMLPVILEQLFQLLKVNAAAFTMSLPERTGLLVELSGGAWANLTGCRLNGWGSDLDRTPGDLLLCCNNETLENPFSPPFDLFNDSPAVVRVPLIASEETVGFLWVGRESPFSDHELRVLVSISDIAASALRRSTLHEDLQAQFEALQKTQARLVQSEKLAAVGELITGVAHELNNPLTSIILFAQLLQQRSLSEEGKRDLDKIISESRRAANIVRGLLDFARQRPPERRPVQINDVVHSTLELLSYELQTHNVHYELSLAPDLPTIQADAHQLQQVFVNLISNAYQAIGSTHHNGFVHIATGMGTTSLPEAASELSSVIRISIDDNGPGISPAIVSRIFDPFFTTKPVGEGTGLGLSICHGIVTEHGGQIWAESRLGQGTTIWVEIPITPADLVEEAIPQVQPEPYQPDTARIFIVDDEKSVLDVLSRVLRQQGYIVEVSNNGEQALLRLQSQPWFDLILCDLHLPGINGMELYWRLQPHQPDMLKRFLFITGDMVSGAVRRFFQDTGAPFLSKPFELPALVERVQIAIASSRKNARSEVGTPLANQ